MYSVRDLFGHFVKLPPRKNEDGMCPHPCCKGRRPHPDRFPVMLPKGVLRSASDEDLERHLQKPTVGADGAAVVQVVDELQRREDKQRTTAAARDRSRSRRSGEADEYRAWLENEWVSADGATRGNMLNKRGVAKGIDPRALWTANDRTREAYASQELREFWHVHPVISRAEFTSGQAADRARQRRRTSSLYGVY